MLTIFGRESRQSGFCDGMNRRNFLTIGGMAMGGLALNHLLALEARAGSSRTHKAVINVFLPGGPPHQDMWDIKQDAPVDVRGEFNPIKTNVSGIEISEMFPRIAAMADKFAFIRSVVGAGGGHDSYQCMTGRKNMPAPAGGWPSMGAWVSKLQGSVSPGIPPHLTMMYKTDHKEWGDPGHGGFLGMAHSPFRLVGGREEVNRSDNMTLQGITLDRLQDRKALLGAFDRFRREMDTTGNMNGIDAFTNQAIGVLTDSKLADAIDLSKEDPKIVERYGTGTTKFRDDGAPKMNTNLLIARRLVEAGARVVSLNFSRWDWHGQNFQASRQDMPLLDQCVSALVTDLHERGMDRDVSVVVWGEFGRTPKINKDAGRDHWPQVSCALLAGGGMKTGQVIGSTNKLGEYAETRPVTFQEIFATLYTNLGLNLRAVREFDLRGRPQYLVDEGTEAMRELV